MGAFRSVTVCGCVFSCANTKRENAEHPSPEAIAAKVELDSLPAANDRYHVMPMRAQASGNGFDNRIFEGSHSLSFCWLRSRVPLLGLEWLVSAAFKESSCLSLRLERDSLIQAERDEVVRQERLKKQAAARARFRD